MKIKKICIVGSGALGIMYGSQILKNATGVKLQFIADKDRIKKYENIEFKANGVKQTFEFIEPGKIKNTDLIIFAVKYNQLESAIVSAKNAIGENTIIISIMNGINSEEIISKTYGEDRIIHAMVAGMDAVNNNYNSIFSKMGYVSFGKLSGNRSDKNIKKLAAFFEEANIKYKIESDIMKAMWWKFIVNIGINQTSALLKSNYALFQTTEYGLNLMKMTMNEAYGISKQLNIGLTDEDIQKGIDTMNTLARDSMTSMCQDIIAKRHTEIDMFAGEIMRLGNELNTPVPINTFLYNGIKALESQF